MSNPSNAAKAAAVLHHTYGVETPAQALELYGSLETAYSNGDPLLDALPESVGWYVCFENLDESEIWENICCLAASIDTCQAELPNAN